MRTLYLNGSRMTDKASAYQHIEQTLAFRDYFGKNLDALYDALSTYGEAKICLLNAEDMLNALGAYGCKLLACCFDAAAANEKISFRLSK